MTAGVRIDLQGATAVVSGGAGGIGRAVCSILLASGADVVSIDRPEALSVDGAANLGCDLGDATAIEGLADRLPDRVDCFVHCAGITRDDVSWKLDPKAWSEVLRVNLDSAFHLTRLLTPALRDGGGSIVFLSSINGERGKFGQSNYAASKAGLIAFGKSLARELGRFSVRCNSIAPGWIDTPMTRSLPDEFRERALSEAALPRLGTPQDVASAVLFLCSPLAAHITGQVLRVDGGQCTA